MGSKRHSIIEEIVGKGWGHDCAQGFLLDLHSGFQGSVFHPWICTQGSPWDLCSSIILAGFQEPFAVPGKEPGCKVISPWASPPAWDLNPYSVSLWHSGKSAPRVCGNRDWTIPNPSDREWPLPMGHTCHPLPPHLTPTSLPVPMAPPCSRDTCPRCTQRQLNIPLVSSWSWGAGF